MCHPVCAVGLTCGPNVGEQSKGCYTHARSGCSCREQRTLPAPTIAYREDECDCYACGSWDIAQPYTEDGVERYPYDFCNPLCNVNSFCNPEVGLPSTGCYTRALFGRCDCAARRTVPFDPNIRVWIRQHGGKMGASNDPVLPGPNFGSHRLGSPPPSLPMGYMQSLHPPSWPPFFPRAGTHAAGLHVSGEPPVGYPHFDHPIDMSPTAVGAKIGSPDDVAVPGAGAGAGGGVGTGESAGAGAGAGGGGGDLNALGAVKSVVSADGAPVGVPIGTASVLSERVLTPSNKEPAHGAVGDGHTEATEAAREAAGAPPRHENMWRSDHEGAAGAPPHDPSDAAHMTSAAIASAANAVNPAPNQLQPDAIASARHGGKLLHEAGSAEPSASANAEPSTSAAAEPLTDAGAPAPSGRGRGGGKGGRGKKLGKGKGGKRGRLGEIAKAFESGSVASADLSALAADLAADLGEDSSDSDGSQ